MSDDTLEATLRAFAAGASPPKQQPAAPAPLTAVDLATRGERIVLLDIGRTSPGRVPVSAPDGSQHDTIAAAALRYVQAHFPGAGCSPKGGGSSSENVLVFCFPPTVVGLRGYDWFHQQGQECEVPIPDSDITVRIPMKAWVAQPGGRARQVSLTLHNVPSELWVDGLAAELLKHYALTCDVRSEYAPDYHHKGTTYHGILRRGCIKAELAPAPDCDLGKLPSVVQLGGRLVKLQVYGYGARPQGRSPRPASSPRPPHDASGPGSDPAASRRQRRNQQRNRNRAAARARGAQGGAAVESTTVLPSQATAGLAAPEAAVPPPAPSQAPAAPAAGGSAVVATLATPPQEAAQPTLPHGSAAATAPMHVESALVARAAPPSCPSRAIDQPTVMPDVAAVEDPTRVAGTPEPHAAFPPRQPGSGEECTRGTTVAVPMLATSPAKAADIGSYAVALTSRPPPSPAKSPASSRRTTASGRMPTSSPRTAQPRGRQSSGMSKSPTSVVQTTPQRGVKERPQGRARPPLTPHKAGGVTDPVVSPNRFSLLDDIDITQGDPGWEHQGEDAADGRRASARIALLPPKNYKDNGPIPPVDSGGYAAEAPIPAFV